MIELTNKPLVVKKSPIHGLGVFTTKDLTKDELIEECHVILAKGTDKNLENYYFFIDTFSAVVTGFGLIYNHSDQNNAIYFYDELRNLMIISAKKNIKRGEEIFIFYGQTWFANRKMLIKKMPWWQKCLNLLKRGPLRSGIIIGGIFLFNQLLFVLFAK